MQKVNVVETFLDFQDRLVHRECTDMIVVHHTGECGYDNDWSAEKIHRMHIEDGLVSAIIMLSEKMALLSVADSIGHEEHMHREITGTQ